MRPRKSPPEGTNIRSERERNAARAEAIGMAQAAVLISTDEDVSSLCRAKRDRDEQEIARLLPRLIERYGRGPKLLRLFRAL